MPKISVIIPSFNESQNIEKCLRSALADCSGDVEFIVIDDGSQDDTVDIVENLIHNSENGPGIIVKRNTGKGVIAAREYGISLASGNYIAFLDADDTVEKGTFRILLDEIESSEADIVCFGNDEVYGGSVRPCPFKGFTTNHEQRIRDCISLKTSPYLCTKLIRKELLTKIAIPPGNLAEDWAISVQLFLLSDKVAILDNVLYHYHIHSTSLSHYMPTLEIRKNKALEEKKNVDFICSILESNGLSKEYADEIVCRKTNVKRILFPALKGRNDYMFWRTLFPEINFAVFSNPLVGMEYRFKHFLSQLMILHLVYPFLVIKRKLLRNETV